MTIDASTLRNFGSSTWMTDAGPLLNNFQIPRRTEPGEYQICRDALTAEKELCADLTIIGPVTP